MASRKTVKVVLRHRSMDARAGDVIEVDAEHAEHLIANGNAAPHKGEKSEG